MSTLSSSTETGCCENALLRRPWNNFPNRNLYSCACGFGWIQFVCDIFDISPGLKEIVYSARMLQIITIVNCSHNRIDEWPMKTNPKCWKCTPSRVRKKRFFFCQIKCQTKREMRSHSLQHMLPAQPLQTTVAATNAILLKTILSRERSEMFCVWNVRSWNDQIEFQATFVDFVNAFLFVCLEIAISYRMKRQSNYSQKLESMFLFL